LSRFLHGDSKRQPSKNRRLSMGRTLFFLLTFFSFHGRLAIEFVHHLKPGLAPLHVIKILQLDYFSASRQINCAYAAPLPSPGFIYLDYFSPFTNFVPRPRLPCLKFVPGLQKHAPYLSCHRDSFVAKAPGQVAGGCAGNTTSLYCRAVSWQL
jgi:hypothetical protein